MDKPKHSDTSGGISILTAKAVVTQPERVKQKVPESGVLKACLDLLAAEKIWHRRWNTGAVKTGKRFFRFGEPGDGDILVLPRSLRVPGSELGTWARWIGGAPAVLWIECKSDSGAQTKDQRDFQKEVESQGHHYLLVRDVDTLREWLKTHGV